MRKLYGQYMLAQAVAGRVPAKLQVFLAAWSLAAEQRERLEANRKPGTTRVWCYAPGYVLPVTAGASNRSDPSDLSDPTHMTALTGFVCRPATPDGVMATPTAEGRRLGLAEPWGVGAKVSPLFAIEAPAADMWATYADGSAAVAVRRTTAGVDVFVGVPRLTQALVRALARLAGVPLFTEVDAAVWAADPYLSIHALADEDLTVNTGCNQPVRGALEGSRLGNGPEVILKMRKGETRVVVY